MGPRHGVKDEGTEVEAEVGIGGGGSELLSDQKGQSWCPDKVTNICHFHTCRKSLQGETLWLKMNFLSYTHKSWTILATSFENNKLQLQSLNKQMVRGMRAVKYIYLYICYNCPSRNVYKTAKGSKGHV
jgi:hypothetical protein